MASIKKRNQTYQVQIRRKGYPSISKCFTTARAAKAWAAEQEASLENSQSPLKSFREKEVPDLQTALGRYQLEISCLKKSAGKEKSFIKYWRDNHLSSVKLTQITPQHIASCRESMLKEGKSAATVVRVLALLSHLFTVATKEWGYPTQNPVQAIRKPKVSNARSRRPTQTELQAILSQVTSNEVKLFIQLAAQTAMRRGELFSLTWSNVDLELRRVFLWDTKNGTDRTVVISNASVNLFKELDTTRQGRVFQIKHVDTPSKAFRRALIRARGKYEEECRTTAVEAKVCHLSNLRLHDMRHEATSALFERGLSIPEVAAITGHKTLAMLGRYTHLTPDLL